MKLPMPGSNEIYQIAQRTEEAIYNSGSRSADRLLIENAIRQALQIVVDRLDIHVNPITVDLSKS